MNRFALAHLCSFLALFLGCAAKSIPEAPSAAPLATAPTELPAPVVAAPTPSAAPIETPPPPPAPPFFSEELFDVAIRGGFVVDGTASPRIRADVLIRGDRVIFVGNVDERVKAKRQLDASNALVAPGFFDMHAHGGPLGDVEYALAQGITTLVLGQDGQSPSEHIGQWLAKVDVSRPRINIATLVGHASVRLKSGAGLRKVPRAKEIERMQKLVAEAMDQGAFGLSMGLEYDPGRSTEMAELVAVAEPVGARGGVVMSHLRSEDEDRIDAALDELVEQCSRSGARAHVSHLKIVLGRGEERAAKLLARMNEARARGVSLTADLYPYAASYTSLSILFPDFARPPASYADAKRSRRADLESFVRARVEKRNGPEATVFGTGPHTGKTLAAVAKERGVPFENVLIDLGPNGAEAAYFVMDEVVVQRLFSDPFVTVGTDGGGGARHPRGFGAFAKIIEDFVGKRHVVSIEEAVRKMACLPAQTLGLSGERGCLAAGCAADVVVFEPSSVHARADFSAPHKLATGMRFVIVGGVVEREGERAIPGRGGKALRFPGRAKTNVSQ